MQFTEQQRENFSRKFEAEPNSGCWLWSAGVAKGYGLFKLSRKMTQSHRVSYAMSNGPFDPSLQVLHKCDTPLCVNPAHLFLGTHADNMRDMALKGRASRFPPKYTRLSLEEKGFIVSSPSLPTKAIARSLGRAEATVTRFRKKVSAK